MVSSRSIEEGIKHIERVSSILDTELFVNVAERLMQALFVLSTNEKVYLASSQGNLPRESRIRSRFA